MWSPSEDPGGEGRRRRKTDQEKEDAEVREGPQLPLGLLPSREEKVHTRNSQPHSGQLLNRRALEGEPVRRGSRGSRPGGEPASLRRMGTCRETERK